MFNEHTIAKIAFAQKEIRTPSSAGDMVIGVREYVLNRLAGVDAFTTINQSVSSNTTPPMADLAGRLKETIARLKAAMMDERGALVDYAAVRASADYAAYRQDCLAALARFQPRTLPDDNARRAFWINLYNALMIDAVINFGVRSSVIEGRLGILTFFRRSAYLVDGVRVSLEDIEHGILRANRGTPYLPGAHFRSDNQRLAWSLPLDPRIHFALNCASKSCPPIRAYARDRLDRQLNVATQAFVDNSIHIRPGNKQLLLSQIFHWYASDFGGRKGIIDLIIRYLPKNDERRTFLAASSESLRLKYTPYDWGLNTV